MVSIHENAKSDWKNDSSDSGLTRTKRECGQLNRCSDESSTETKGDFMSKLSNKVALVTGGSRGIGAAIAKRLAADGASVAITYSKRADAAASVVKAIESKGGKAVAIQADAADPKAINAAVEKTVATLGKLDVLVNNAGTAIRSCLRRLRWRRSIT
jgi:3-oxoacyl-ACP reductase-like protein